MKSSGDSSREEADVECIDSKENKVTALPSRVPLAMLVGVFLTSLSVLLLEITLTRILSVILLYHYVFVVVSMALVGLGAGGTLSYLLRSKISPGSLPAFGGIFAISIVSSVLGLAKLGAISIFVDSLIIVVPFFFAGVVLSRVFQEYASQSGKVYAADLIGAAAGAFLAVPLLDRLSGINSALLTGIVAAGAGLSFFRKTKIRIWFPVLSLVLSGALFLAGVYAPMTGDIVLRPDLNKELVADLSDGDVSVKIVATRWSSFGRTDLVEYGNTPEIKAIYIDATARTLMYRFNGDITNPDPAIAGLRENFLGYYPLQYLKPEQKDNALIIGPGGGRDVLVALLSGINNITAVEVNPDTVALVKEYSFYNGGLYTNFPNVKIVTGEGRNYLRQQTEKYDVIMLSIPVTKTSRSPEGFALTENFLFTKDSIADYFDHLTDNGRLIIVTHGTVEVMRLISLSHDVLNNVTATELMNQIYTLGSRFRGVFVLSKTKIDPRESYLVHEVLHTANWEPGVSYLPNIETTKGAEHIQETRFDQCQMFNPSLVAMSLGYLSQADLVRDFALTGLNISTVTDENPFFYNFEVGIAGVLAFGLMLSLLVVLVTILISGLLYRKMINRETCSGKGHAGNRWLYPAIFALIGIGFMMAEIPLIQRFTLFLGEPVLSVSVLLFSLLIGAGTGGLASSRVSPNGLARKTGFAAIVVASLLLLYALVTPAVLKQFPGLTLVERSLLSAAALLPLGFALGFPFPLGIRLVREKVHDNFIPWMWGINGSASVLGSFIAVVVAIKFGFYWVMIIGAVCYVIAWLILHVVSHTTWSKIE